MKTLEQILKQGPLYLNRWSSKIEQDSAFYEVSAGQFPCYGVEEQWSPKVVFCQN